MNWTGWHPFTYVIVPPTSQSLAPQPSCTHLSPNLLGYTARQDKPRGGGGHLRDSLKSLSLPPPSSRSHSPPQPITRTERSPSQTVSKETTDGVVQRPRFFSYSILRCVADVDPLLLRCSLPCYPRILTANRAPTSWVSTHSFLTCYLTIDTRLCLCACLCPSFPPVAAFTLVFIGFGHSDQRDEQGHLFCTCPPLQACILRSPTTYSCTKLLLHRTCRRLWSSG